MDRELKYPTRPILQCGQTKKLPIQTIFCLFCTGYYFIDPSFGAFEPVEVLCKFHPDHAETCVETRNKVRLVDFSV